MDSTLDKRIAAMRGSLMDAALESAESRGQRLAGVAHVLYALYRDDGFAGRLPRAHGLETAVKNCPSRALKTATGSASPIPTANAPS